MSKTLPRFYFIDDCAETVPIYDRELSGDEQLVAEAYTTAIAEKIVQALNDQE